MLHEQGEITQTVACNLLHEQDGIKQMMCLNARSLLGRFYPFSTMNGKVFRASRCTLRESKTQFNQHRVQLVARTRRNYPDRSVQLVARKRRNETNDVLKRTVIFFGIFIIHTPNLTERYFMHQDARYENPKRD